MALFLAACSSRECVILCQPSSGSDIPKPPNSQGDLRPIDLSGLLIHLHRFLKLLPDERRQHQPYSSPEEPLFHSDESRGLPVSVGCRWQLLLNLDVERPKQPDSVRQGENRILDLVVQYIDIVMRGIRKIRPGQICVFKQSILKIRFLEICP